MIEIILFLTAFLLRLYPLIKIDFWLDESAAFFISHGSTISALISTKPDESHNFLYYLFLKFWLKFNTSYIFLRLPSLIAAMVSIYLAYLIAKEIQKKWKVKHLDLLVVFLLSFSCLHIEYSFQARQVIFLIMFSTLAAYCLLRYLLGKQAKYLSFYTFINIVGFYTDYGYMWFIIAMTLMMLIFLVARRFRKIISDQALKQIIKAQLISLVFILPWTIVIYKNFPAIMERIQWIEKPNFKMFCDSYLHFFGFSSSIPFSQKFILVFVIVLIILNSLKTSKNYKIIFSWLILMISLSICLLTSFLASKILPQPIFMLRNLMSLITIPIFILSLTLSLLLEKKGHVFNYFLVLAILSLYLISNIHNYKTEVTNDYYYGGIKFKDSALFFQSNLKLLKKGSLIFFPSWNRILFEYYYLNFYKSAYSGDVYPYDFKSDESEIENGDNLYIINPDNYFIKNNFIKKCLKGNPIRYRSSIIYNCKVGTSE